MFHNIPEPIRNRMSYLESIDARDRVDGTPNQKRLRQVPPETGRFLALMAASAPQGQILEIGTSAGYSSLWLILACMQRGDILRTYEILPEKVRLARETFKLAKVSTHVNLIHGDVLRNLGDIHRVALCFLDANKDTYRPCYDLIVPKMVPGGLFLADNMISHQNNLKTLLDHVYADQRVDALIIPVGKGVLVCRRTE